jgi:pantoate--beta-alanine ligase
MQSMEDVGAERTNSVDGFDAWKKRKGQANDVRPVYFVPTMGALHEGHGALIKAARQAGGAQAEVVVSVYVNPTQFNDREDFLTYPKTRDDDMRLAAEAGADIVVFPAAKEMYPKGIPDCLEKVDYGTLTRLWEAACRPGHFDGVVAVVRSLFEHTQPALAFFGEKDWQQLAVIRRLAAEEFPGTTVVSVETVREFGGLAKSSRNTRLSEAGRKHAQALHSALLSAAEAKGEPRVMEGLLRSLAEDGFDVEYFAVVNADTLSQPWSGSSAGRVLVAAKYEGVRLIDNVEVLP